VATGQLRDAGHIVTVPIELDDHAKLTLTDFCIRNVWQKILWGANNPR
jgi:hypothetical protein